MTRPLLIGALLTTAVLRDAAAQLPFTVTIVDWQRDVAAGQGRAYRGEPSGEVLYCVESWKTVSGDGQYNRIIIESVRKARTGKSDNIRNVGAACVGSKGEPLPMFHTHSDGNCQFSPTDLVTVVARRAPFEGVQCGEHYFIWAFAWQVLAIANSVEMAQLKWRTFAGVNAFWILR